jgi:uncharacterized protein (TIGR03435 family)
MSRVLLLLVFAWAVYGAAPPPSFDVVSIKHAGDVGDGGRWEGQVHYGRTSRPVQLKGGRLSGELPLIDFVSFAFSTSIANCECPDWMKTEWYRIEAIAPVGTTIESAGVMLQAALIERLDLRFHMTEKERRVLILRRGTGDLKLMRSTEAEPAPGLRKVGVFQHRSASLRDFAAFLSAVAGLPVVDKSGIAGQYNVHVDWSAQLDGAWEPNPSLAISGVKQYGLKLEPGRETRRILVIDRVKMNPSPN